MGWKKRFIQQPVSDRKIVLRNRYAIAIQNLPLSILLPRIPLMLFVDFVSIFYYIFFSFSSFKAFFSSYFMILKDLRLMLRKRKIIMSSRKSTNKELKHMFSKVIKEVRK